MPLFIHCVAISGIKSKITKKTKAIIGVHLYGQPFDMDAVKEIAKKHKLLIVEDCAQAHGAKYKGIKVGGFGEVGCFSFYPGKNLGAYGEGGGITTNSQQYYEHMSAQRNHGSTTRYYHDMLGFNMRMDGLQGAILDIKLKYLDGWNNRRKKIAKKYLTDITNSKIKMQKQPDFTDSVFHLFVVTTENRDALMEHLNTLQIFPGLHYPVPCHLQKVYAGLGYKKGDFPHAEYLSEHCLSLPMYAELSDDEVERIIVAVNSF